MEHEERYPVRCRECGNVIAVRQDNDIISTMRHRSRKKEVHIRLRGGQKMNIICDKCGCSNTIVGA